MLFLLDYSYAVAFSAGKGGGVNPPPSHFHVFINFVIRSLCSRIKQGKERGGVDGSQSLSGSSVNNSTCYYRTNW